MCQHPFEGIIASADQRGNIHVWSVEALLPLSKINIHELKSYANRSFPEHQPQLSNNVLPEQPIIIAFSPDGSQLAMVDYHLSGVYRLLTIEIHSKYIKNETRLDLDGSD